MEERSRRSLLPQMSMKSIPRRESKLPAPNRAVGGSTGPIKNESPSASSALPDFTSEAASVAPRLDTIRPIPRKAIQRTSANIGRSLSQKHTTSQVRKVQDNVQRIPSTKSKDSSSRASLIATPKENFQPKELEDQVSDPRRIIRSPIGKPADFDKTASTKKAQPGFQAHADAPLPNIAVSRHASSHRMTAPQEASRPRSLVSEPAPAPRPTKPSKPAFSTLQQHFTPRKAPKALTSSFLAPSSSGQSDAEKASAEIANLQADLARLHLLHRCSGDMERAWKESARSHLEVQFDEVLGYYYEVNELSRSQEILSNYPALLEWSQNVLQVGFAERLQILSRSLAEITNFLYSDNRYQRVLKIFDTWLNHATGVLESRKAAVEGSLDFVEQLGDDWKAEVAKVETKLASMSRELERLGKPRAGSTLGQVVGLLRNASRSMLEELETVRAIESALVASEAKWIHEKVSKVVSETHGRKTSSVLPHEKVWHDR